MPDDPELREGKGAQGRLISSREPTDAFSLERHAIPQTSSLESPVGSKEEKEADAQKREQAGISFHVTS